MLQELDQVKINSSLGNFLDKSMPYTLLWTVNRFVSTAQQAGYAGLEWHPFRLPMTGLQIRNDTVSQHEKNGIKSLHQSFRGEKNIFEAWHHSNRTLALIAYTLLPETVKSLNHLEHIQMVVGKRLPTVLYPPLKLGEESGVNRPFAEKLFQPTPEVAKRWYVQSVKELVGEAQRRGYTGFCLDLYHFRESGEVDFDPWQSLLPYFLSFTKEIHISAGRLDMNDKNIDTMAELKDLLDGTNNTDLPKILIAIRDIGWRGLITTEIPAAALKSLDGSQRRFLPESYFIEYHQRITDTITGLLSS